MLYFTALLDAALLGLALGETALHPQLRCAPMREARLLPLHALAALNASTLRRGATRRLWPCEGAANDVFAAL